MIKRKPAQWERWNVITSYADYPGSRMKGKPIQKGVIPPGVAVRFYIGNKLMMGVAEAGGDTWATPVVYANKGSRSNSRMIVDNRDLDIRKHPGGRV